MGFWASLIIVKLLVKKSRKLIVLDESRSITKKPADALIVKFLIHWDKVFSISMHCSTVIQSTNGDKWRTYFLSFVTDFVKHPHSASIFHHP